MENALIISDSPKAASFYQDFLKSSGFSKFTQCSDGEEGKRSLLDADYDVCIINSPLLGRSGENLAIDIAAKNLCQVILFVRTEYYESISEKVENYGVITLEKPISRKLFWSALKLTKVTAIRMEIAQKEIKKLQRKLVEQKDISRAKCILIEKNSMTEDEAHKYIEKNAMNQRVSRWEIAIQVIDYYD